MSFCTWESEEVYRDHFKSGNLNLKTGYIHAPYFNGLGRFVLQCQRITVKFCKEWGDSEGVREWIRHDAVNFAKANPSVVLYLKPRRHRSPVLVAEYLNGGREWINLHKNGYDEVGKWIETLRTRSGNGEMNYKNYHRTLVPSIQGIWTPFTHKAPEKNLMSFPNADLSLPSNLAPTTTELILEMYGKPPVIPKQDDR